MRLRASVAAALLVLVVVIAFFSACLECESVHEKNEPRLYLR